MRDELKGTKALPFGTLKSRFWPLVEVSSMRWASLGESAGVVRCKVRTRTKSSSLEMRL